MKTTESSLLVIEEVTVKVVAYTSVENQSLSIEVPSASSRIDEAVSSTVAAVANLERPPYWDLGGEQDFANYHEALERLCRFGAVSEPLGRRVIVPAVTARHICYKSHPDQEDHLGGGKRDVWQPDRARTLGWLYHALSHPTEVRPSHTKKGRQAYLLRVDGDPSARIPLQHYGVFVEPNERANTITVCSAYPLDPATWSKAKRGGKLIYPIPEK